MNHPQILTWLQDKAAESPTRADRWYHLALALTCANERWEALGALGKATKINPHYAEAGILRCFLLAESGEVAEGFREFRQLFARSPEDFHVVFPLGVFCMRHGWEATGVRLLLQAERLRPSVPYVVLQAAAALRARGDDGAARDRLEQASAVMRKTGLEFGESDPGRPTFRLETWQSWENPCLAKACLLQAEYLKSTGNVALAEEELRRGNSRFPGHAELMVGLVPFLIARARNEEALTWLASAISMDRSCHQAYFESAFLHAEEGQLEKSLQALETAVDIRPFFPDYRYQLGILLLDLGRVEEGIAQLEQVRLLNPFSGHLALHLVSAYLETGDIDRALGVLSESAPKDIPEALILAAQACLERDCHDEARGILERVLEEGSAQGNVQQVLDGLRAPTAMSVRPAE